MNVLLVFVGADLLFVQSGEPGSNQTHEFCAFQGPSVDKCPGAGAGSQPQLRTACLLGS